MQVTEILTDHTLMALDLQGAEDYPIRFYLDIMDQFDRAGIHWHWHPALEFNVITKGTMEYFVENEHYTLTAGQGLDLNVAGDLVAVDGGDDEHGRPVAAGVVRFAHVDGRRLRAVGQEVVTLGSAGKRGAQRDEY